mgnify:FL=1
MTASEVRAPVAGRRVSSHDSHYRLTETAESAELCSRLVVARNHLARAVLATRARSVHCAGEKRQSDLGHAPWIQPPPIRHCTSVPPYSTRTPSILGPPHLKVSDNYIPSPKSFESILM